MNLNGLVGLGIELVGHLVDSPMSHLRSKGRLGL